MPGLPSDRGTCRRRRRLLLRTTGGDGRTGAALKGALASPVTCASPARALRDALEPVAMHAVWAQPVNAALAHDFLTGYVTGRAAPLGEVPSSRAAARLPGDARLTASDAARLIDANFGEAIAAEPATVLHLPAVVAPLGIVGGAVYDALVALAARSHGFPLDTRDARAAGTYASVGVTIEVFEG